MWSSSVLIFVVPGLYHGMGLEYGRFLGFVLLFLDLGVGVGVADGLNHGLGVFLGLAWS